jgi:hypothetical protein
LQSPEFRTKPSASSPQLMARLERADIDLYQSA